MVLLPVMLAATVVLPVTKVTEVAEFKTRSYPGRVVPIAQVNVVPQVSGEILEVGFENGSVVKAGQLLYRLDQVKYEAAVKNAEAKVAECKANLSYAELSYTRHKKLLDSRAVSLDAVDNALSQRDSSRAALAAAQAELVAARDDLKHCRIVAPINAKIGSTAFTKGNYVTTSSGTLVTLVQYRPIRVRFSISNREFLQMFGGSTESLKRDGEVSIVLADGREYTEPGGIEYTENSSDELTDTMQVYACFNNEAFNLKPGGTVTVKLAAKKGVKRPAIPPTAILQDTQGPYVWALDADGKVSRRTVARGDLDGDWLFIEKGLKAGETIVADGAHKVRKGDTVKPAPEVK